MTLVDPRGGGGRQGRAPRGPKFFHFHAVFGNKICKITPTWELAPPPRENPGSATECLLLGMSNCVCISNQNDLHQNYSLCRSEKNAEYCEMPLVLSSSGILVSFAHVYLSILIMCALYVALILNLRKQQKDLVWKIYLSTILSAEIIKFMFQSVECSCLT